MSSGDRVKPQEISISTFEWVWYSLLMTKQRGDLPGPLGLLARAVVWVSLGYCLSTQVGCGLSGADVTTPQPATPKPICQKPGPGVYGVKPLGNKTGKIVTTEGSDDLLLHSMVQSGCYTVAERDRLTLLVEEMKHCDESNKDRSYFDCSSFAKKGKLLGISHMVVGDVVWAEPNIKGADLKLKIPGFGGLDLGRSYGSLGVELRVLEVETGKVLQSTLVHAELPSDHAGVSWNPGMGLQIEATVRSKTSFGKALSEMFDSAAKQLLATGAKTP